MRHGYGRCVRQWGAAAALVALAGGLVTINAGPAPAGVSGGARVEVDKTLVGTAPAGTTFSVTATCTGGDHTVQYDASGTPTSTNSFIQSTAAIIDSCTVNETASGGAGHTAYTCSAGLGETCSSDGTMVALNRLSNDPVTFAVINTFLPPLTVSPNPVSPGQQTTISGTLCTKKVFGGSVGTGGTVQVTVGLPTPITVQTTAAGTTGSWSVQVTVPPGTALTSYPVTATCNDPVPYPASTLTVVAAVTPAFTG